MGFFSSLTGTKPRKAPKRTAAVVAARIAKLEAKNGKRGAPSKAELRRKAKVAVDAKREAWKLARATSSVQRTQDSRLKALKAEQAYREYQEAYRAEFIKRRSK